MMGKKSTHLKLYISCLAQDSAKQLKSNADNEGWKEWGINNLSQNFMKLKDVQNVQFLEHFQW